MSKTAKFLLSTAFIGFSAFANAQDNDFSDPEKQVKYEPFRITGLYQSIDGGNVYGGNISYERKLAKSLNFINYGVELGYSQATTEVGEFYSRSEPWIATESQAINSFFYLSAYLPVNLVTGNIIKKEKGLFPFVRLGLAYSSVIGGFVDTTIPDPIGGEPVKDHVSIKTSSATDFGYDLGVDYKFSDVFGISVITAKFKQFAFGVNFQFGNKKR